MKTIKIYGASDDLIEIEGDIEGCDEYNIISDDYHIAMFSIDNVESEIIIHAIYNGYWCFAVGTMNGSDYDQFPDWEIARQWGTESPYSETLFIDVPDDARIKPVANL